MCVYVEWDMYVLYVVFGTRKIGVLNRKIDVLGLSGNDRFVAILYNLLFRQNSNSNKS